jgi:histone-lysine N-methyltransferase ASH1L
MCEEDTGCDENCQNRYMFYECDNGNCRLGPECGNRNFEGLKHRTKAGGKYNIGVEVIKTQDRGYGVRSNRSFEPNQIIVEYTGEILTQFECEKRMRTVYKNNDVCALASPATQLLLTSSPSAIISCTLIKI